MLGGECRVFERPEYVVLGKTTRDQDWIDGNVEAGVGGCGWERPKPRPPEFDQPSRPGAAAAAPTAKKKRSLIKRAKARVRAIVGKKPAAQTPLPPPPPAAPAIEPAAPAQVTPPPPPPPTDPIDDLLRPTRVIR